MRGVVYVVNDVTIGLYILPQLQSEGFVPPLMPIALSKASQSDSKGGAEARWLL